MPAGTFIQTLNARTIAGEGAPVILSKEPDRKLIATKVDDQRTISRLLPEDGLEATSKTPVVFLFSGALYNSADASQPVCPLAHDDEFAFAGMLFTVDSLHPTFVGGICTELAVLAY